MNERHPDFSTSTGFLLSQSGAAATRAWRSVLDDRGLTARQHGVLLVLRQSGAVGLTELARALQVDPRNLTAVLDPLVEQGLVERGPATDRRRRTVGLTAAGARAADELADATADIEDELLFDLSGDEREQLRGLLLRLRRRVP